MPTSEATVRSNMANVSLDETDEEQVIVLERYNNKFATICNPTSKILKALRNVGENDPAVCLDWNIGNINAAVLWANQNQPALPTWYNAGGYPITVGTIQDALVTLLAQSGSGHQLGRALLAPNDLEQCTRIKELISLLNHMDPFLLAICGGNRCPLARVYVLSDDKKKTTGQHMPMLPLQGVGVQAFE